MFCWNSVQNVISANAVNGTRYPEKQMLSIFHGTCLAVRAMHQHQSGPSARGTNAARSARSGSARRPKMGAQAYPPAQGRSEVELSSTGEELDDFEFEEDEEEEESGGLRSGTNEGQALIGGLESARQQLEEESDGAGMPGIGEEDGATVLGRVGDGQRATGGTLGEGEPVDGQKGGVTPWAHRDIKPVRASLFPCSLSRLFGCPD